MKNLFRISAEVLLTLSIFLMFACTKDEPKNKEITVIDIDGNVYQTVTIGTQVWMKDNLKVSHYNNGDPIPNFTNNTVWSTLKTGAYCDYDNTTGNSTTYGKLYNWYAVTDNRKLCPTGWHVPNSTEWWTTLINYLGGPAIAGGKLKEVGTTHWKSPNTGATNESGFTALPGGISSGEDGIVSGVIFFIGKEGKWWTTSEAFEPSYGDIGGLITLSYDNASTTISYTKKSSGFSVRCLKD